MAISVLVVEDEIGIARLLQLLMERKGFRADIVGDGAHALAYVQQNTPDLILLDLVMPVMDGYEFLQHLRSDQRTSGIPVVVVSTAENIGALGNGPIEYVAKPFDIATLDAAVDRALSVHPPGDP